MSLIEVIITLAVIGLLLWAINKYIPMQPNIKQILNVVVMIIVVIWLLSLFVNLGSLGNVGTKKIN